MASFKSHPIFYTTLLVIGAVTAGEAWLVLNQRSQTAKVAEEIAQKKQELDAFAYKSPFPSRENLALVTADRQKAEQTRSEIRKTLVATSEIAASLAGATVPSSSTDAYFDIANYVERIRASALAAGVVLPAENKLGFSLYGSTGPERDLIAPVFRQRQYADYLLNVLITAKAKPREIISLQREQPLTAAQRQQIADAIASGQPSPLPNPSEGGDYFVVDPRISARVPGFVEASAFRLNFVGTTGALRSLLNELATFALPVVVRSVEVEPLNKTGGGGYTPPPANNSLASLFGGGSDASQSNPAEAVKPLVEQTDSRFVVTVEFISLVDKSAPAPAAETAPEAPTS